MSDETLKLIKEKEVQYVDLRFNDLRGKMQHVTFDVSMVNADLFSEGTMFDGSSIAGWTAPPRCSWTKAWPTACKGAGASWGR